MTAGLRVILRDEAKADLASLQRLERDADENDVPDGIVKKIFEYLVAIGNRKIAGIPLEDLPPVGNLSDCRKVYVDIEKDMSPRFRIVFRRMPTDTTPEWIDVIAIGKRDRMWVYFETAQRLERH